MFKWFSGVKSKEEAKNHYKQLAKKYHPDCGGSNEVMTEINVEYEKIMKMTFDEKERDTKDFIDIINQIIKYDINIESIGTWLWVSGKNTFGIKAELMTIGFKWSSNRKMWYIADGNYKRKKGSQLSTDEIRTLYGNTVFKKSNNKESINLKQG